jgi:DNA helicase IV
VSDSLPGRERPRPDAATILAGEQETVDDLYTRAEALARQLEGPVHAATSAAAKAAQQMRLARLDQLREALNDRSRLLTFGRIDFSGGSHVGRTVYIGRTLIGDPDEEYPPMSSWKAEIAGAFFNPLGFEDGSSVELKRFLIGEDRIVRECIDERPQEIRAQLERLVEERAAGTGDAVVSRPEDGVPEGPATDLTVPGPEDGEPSPPVHDAGSTGQAHVGRVSGARSERPSISVPAPGRTPPTARPERRTPVLPVGDTSDRPEAAPRPVASGARAGSTGSGFGDPLVQRLLDRQGTGLGPIVETIQARQYELMERPIDRTLVIQGGPGTGKTVIALHRIAVQLYRARGALAQSDILFVGPSRTFVGYVDRVLPSLGEHDVIHRAIQDLATHGAVPTGHDPAEVALVKGLPQMAEVIDRFLRGRARIDRRDIRLGDGALSAVAPESLRAVLDRAQGLARSYGELRARFRQLLGSDDVLRELAGDGRTRGRIVLDQALADAIADDSVPTLSPRAVIHELLTSPLLLESAADGLLTPAQQATIRRRAASVGQHPWTYEDFPLLDEVADQAGPDRRPRRYAHVVIDEAQDFSAMQLRMVRRRAGGGITVLGDLAQASTGWSPATWDEHLGSGGIEVDDFEELAQSYRTTRPILDAANLLLLVIDLGLEPPRAVIGEGSPVLATPLGDPNEDAYALACAIVELRERGRDEETIGVIGPAATLERIRAGLAAEGVPASTVTEDVSAPVVLVPVDDAKGLEFDHVLVVEPERINRSDPATGPRKLYVAMTRARRSLRLLHRDRLPRVLAGSSEIVRTPAFARTPASTPREPAPATVPPPGPSASPSTAGRGGPSRSSRPTIAVDGTAPREPSEPIPRPGPPAHTDPSTRAAHPIGPCAVRTGHGEVVLTDHPGLDRRDLIVHAERLGFSVRPEVTASTALVVVGRTTSASRRARLARDLGVPLATARDLLATSPGAAVPAEVQMPGVPAGTGRL